VVDKYESVTQFVDALDGTEQGAIVAALRKSLLADPRVSEILKWNSPSYVVDGTDCFTITVRGSKPVLLVLHAGAVKTEVKGAAPVVDDPTGLLEWRSDIRATISFTNAADVDSKADALRCVLDMWVTTL
jgi:hypothetical protein